jgi:uncharacterized protein (TIGR00251 family)
MWDLTTVIPSLFVSDEQFFIRAFAPAMKLIIHVRPNSKKNEVEVRQDGSLLIRVTSPPVEGKANKKALEVLAAYLRKPKSSLKLLAGYKSKRKTVEVV